MKAYIKRFNDELATMHNPQENGVMMATISGVQPDTLFWDKLQKDECKTLAEFFRYADKIMRLQTAWEAIQVGKSAPIEKNNDNGKKRKNGNRHPSPDKKNKKPKAPDMRVPRPPPSKFTNYTDLVSSREDVFIAVEQTGVFKWPNPLCGDCSKKNQNKYCRYHKDVGHTTKECITLKDEIKKLIRCKTMHLRQSPHTRSGRSLADLTSPEKRIGRRNDTSGRQRRGPSLMFIVRTSSL